jgi:hypothetical protein
MKQLVRAGVAGRAADLVEHFPQRRPVVFLHCNREIAPHEDIQVAGLEISIFAANHRLEHGEQIGLVLLDFRALVAVAAVFDVQRMQPVTLGQPVQFRIGRIADLVPDHIR